MTLGNMRAMGVRSIDATCEDCRHEATVSVECLARSPVRARRGAQDAMLGLRVEGDQHAAELARAQGGGAGEGKAQGAKPRP
jgi:hypothetical protein